MAAPKQNPPATDDVMAQALQALKAAPADDDFLGNGDGAEQDALNLYQKVEGEWRAFIPLEDGRTAIARRPTMKDLRRAGFKARAAKGSNTVETEITTQLICLCTAIGPKLLTREEYEGMEFGDGVAISSAVSAPHPEHNVKPPQPVRDKVTVNGIAYQEIVLTGGQKGQYYRPSVKQVNKAISAATAGLKPGQEPANEVIIANLVINCCLIDEKPITLNDFWELDFYVGGLFTAKVSAKKSPAPST